jgi:hypothetical protein
MEIYKIMPTKKPSKTKEVIDKVFRDPELAYSLKEFENIDIDDVLDITEEENGKFYIKDLKSKKLKVVFDEEKQKGRPEEIVRQLWLYKLNTQYKYPFERMDTKRIPMAARRTMVKAKKCSITTSTPSPMPSSNSQKIRSLILLHEP